MTARSMSPSCHVAAAVLTLCTAVCGGIVVPLDPDVSTVRVQLCILEECDSDVSPVEGFAEISLHCPEAPLAIALHDLDAQATQTIALHLDYGILGDIFVTGTGMGVSHAAPDPDAPFVPVINGEFVFTNVPVQPRGTIEYHADGAICTILQSNGAPCDDVIVLDEEPPATADAIPGTITVAGGQIHLMSTLEITAPVDPDNPDLGTITVQAFLAGSAPLPTPGDLDFDGDVDIADFALFASCFTGSGVSLMSGCQTADFDCDNDVDIVDFATLAAGFTGSQ